ncbi:transposase [Pseudanabaena galeata UHCC 0370]|uniref:Transposase n=1 Tax=Pseudanabaena galeata UHCC 0370 TaxID=3110310 RepID=A0ABU5TQN4_9CYAN|nr:transposase [Pseudanabaena galeata]MEA5480605.1 transposase [Pseudanabaena galeata UHCC 0370]
MPSRSINFEQGRYYHVYNRGNNCQPIFFDKENYLYFLRLSRYYLVDEHISILAYCLMPNHYHFLVQCNGGNLSEAMKLLSLTYTKSINKRFNRVGSLFQGRFKAILVDSDEYLVHLVRYIHLNPVKADLVNSASEWEFSSFSEYAGIRRGSLPSIEFVRSMIGSDEEYFSFLNECNLPSIPQLMALMLDE